MVEAFRPQDLKEALELLAFTDYTILAGGTDLMVKKKQWTGLTPDFDKPVMFISELEELRKVAKQDNYLSIGAACTLAELIKDELIPEYFRIVLRQMASPGIRNAATIGGNICNASPAGDCLPLLYALDAAVVIQSSCRTIVVPVSEFIQGPGATLLRPGELVTAIRIPESQFSLFKYKKVGTRRATSLSKLSFIGLADINAEGLQDIRIAFGAVAATVVRSRDVEEELIEMIRSGSLDICEIIRDYMAFIKPITDQRSTAFYRKEVCKRLLVDFISWCQAPKSQDLQIIKEEVR